MKKDATLVIFDVKTDEAYNLFSIIENTWSYSNTLIPGMTDFSIESCYYSK